MASLGHNVLHANVLSTEERGLLKRNLLNKHWSLQWRHNKRHSVANHRRLYCLLNRFLRHRSKKTPKLRVSGLCEGNSAVTGHSPHKGPVTRKSFHLMTPPCVCAHPHTYMIQLLNYTVTSMTVFLFKVAAYMSNHVPHIIMIHIDISISLSTINYAESV